MFSLLPRGWAVETEFSLLPSYGEILRTGITGGPQNIDFLGPGYSDKNRETVEGATYEQSENFFLFSKELSEKVLLVAKGCDAVAAVIQEGGIPPLPFYEPSSEVDQFVASIRRGTFQQAICAEDLDALGDILKGPYPKLDSAFLLSLAVQTKNAAVVELLLEHGLDPNVGEGFIFAAGILTGDLQVVEVLLKYGANPAIGGNGDLFHSYAGKVGVEEEFLDLVKKYSKGSTPSDRAPPTKFELPKAKL